MADVPPEAWEHDPFHPPSIPIEVHCIHCDQEYDSYLIEWRDEVDASGNPHGFWCCPIPGCDGKGFGFDIFPTDPDYVDENTGEPMWVSDDPDCTGEEDCICEMCMIDCGELDPEDVEPCEDETVPQFSNSDDNEEDEGGGVAMHEKPAFEYGDAGDDFPLDDLLPESEDCEPISISYKTMIEIEEKLGFRKPQPKFDEPPKSKSDRDHNKIIDDDDIPF